MERTIYKSANGKVHFTNVLSIANLMQFQIILWNNVFFRDFLVTVANYHHGGALTETINRMNTFKRWILRWKMLTNVLTTIYVRFNFNHLLSKLPSLDPGWPLKILDMGFSLRKFVQYPIIYSFKVVSHGHFDLFYPFLCKQDVISKVLTSGLAKQTKCDASIGL